jgi:hypothetical protein
MVFLIKREKPACTWSSLNMSIYGCGDRKRINALKQDETAVVSGAGPYGLSVTAHLKEGSRHV